MCYDHSPNYRCTVDFCLGSLYLWVWLDHLLTLYGGIHLEFGSLKYSIWLLWSHKVFCSHTYSSVCSLRVILSALRSCSVIRLYLKSLFLFSWLFFIFILYIILHHSVILVCLRLVFMQGFIEMTDIQVVRNCYSSLIEKY